MDFAPLAHIFPDTARVDGSGRLELGGLTVTELADRFGTPLYVLCDETLRARFRAYRSAFASLHADTEVAYAAKAYLGPAMAQIVAEEGAGLDVVSGGELAVARLVEFPPERITFHGNNKLPQELMDALDYGVGRVVLDSLHELDLLEGLARDRGVVQPVLLRVNPDVDARTHSHTTTGNLDSKFGIPIPTGQAGEALRRAVASPSLRLTGLHFHLGSPIFELAPYAAAIDIVLAFAAGFRDEGFNLDELSPGGGFAIAYTRDQHPPTPQEYAAIIVEAVRAGCRRYDIPLPRLLLEPGRAIVGPAGVALYSVGSVKEGVRGVRTYAAVDGGMGDNIRPALYDAQYEAVAADRLGEEPECSYAIVGKFCESGDILVKEALLPTLATGDLIALPAAGAYSPAMASNYNLNPRPPIVLVRGGQARPIRRRETVEDMVRADLW